MSKQTICDIPGNLGFWSMKFAATALLCVVSTSAQSQELNPTTVETNAFLAADVDQNGVLTRTEFKTFVKRMAAAGQPTARQIRFFGAYNHAFSIADADRNGFVTPIELRRADSDFRANN